MLIDLLQGCKIHVLIKNINAIKNFNTGKILRKADVPTVNISIHVSTNN